MVVCALVAWQHLFGLWKAAPGPLLLLVLAAGAFWGGLRAGLLSATAAIAYLAYVNFSLDYSGQLSLLERNVARFTLLSLAALVVVISIGTLRGRLAEAIRKVADLQSRHEERKNLENVIDDLARDLTDYDRAFGLTDGGLDGEVA